MLNGIFTTRFATPNSPMQRLVEDAPYALTRLLMPGGLGRIRRAIIDGLMMIGMMATRFEVRWQQPRLGGNTECWFAIVLALVVLLFRPQGVFGERIIERVCARTGSAPRAITLSGGFSRAFRGALRGAS